MNKRFIVFISILTFFCYSFKSQITNRILFIFDDSYSMYGPWKSDIKIEVAKKVMGEFLDSLENISNLEKLKSSQISQDGERFRVYNISGLEKWHFDGVEGEHQTKGWEKPIVSIKNNSLQIPAIIF